MRLCKQIAEQVLRSDGFVFFHVDSDVAWGAGRSPNLDRFEEVIRRKVSDIVRGHLAESNVGEAQIEARMSKLIMLAPHYSIEAWLFANVDRLRECGAVGPILDQWQADAATLEQTVNPKQLVSVSTRDYPTLARELRTAKLYELQSSFADTVNRAGACGGLVVRLRGRWPQWVRTAHGLG
ncbi:hypothetical protein [Enhygromyxa salina]|uniref:hypothetical protein n=1 Tax=Enhygromyxa salina TaxID=215803 RepID=UPI0011B23D08|nr:hypothetical protein [Enhygromyxa salina]